MRTTPPRTSGPHRTPAPAFTLAPAFALALALATSPARAEEVKLTVLHTTDLHGALTAYDYATDRPFARGLVKIATMVKRARAENPNVLLLDAGDCITGGAIETAWRAGRRSDPEPMMTAMNVIGYDAFAVGNHEFDVGLEQIEQARLAARFPWLAANVRRIGDRAPAFDASFVKILNGVRVGVVGLCTPAVPAWVDSANWDGLGFESPIEAAQREVRWLRDQERCDVVLLLAHTGLEREVATGRARRGDTASENWGYRLATEVQGVDAVILGHTHVTVPAVEIEGRLVTQAGKWAEHLGRLDLTVSRESASARWAVRAKQARVIAVTDSIPNDPELEAFAAPYHEAAQAMLNEVVGEAAVDIASPHGRLHDGPVWDLVHRAQLDATGADVSLAALFDPGARIARGKVTVRDLTRVYQYENTLGVIQMSGADLKATLEESARYFAPYGYERGASLVSGDVQGFNYDTAEGLDYEVDLSRPVGDRIIHLHYRGAPLARDTMLRVVTNNYRMSGGGNYARVRTARRVSRHGSAREALIAYVRKAGPLDGATSHNWTLLPDYALTPERPFIDLLVRQGVAPREEVHRMFPDEIARRGDLAYWLARSFGWREKRLSGAFADVPDSLEPWLDGLLKRKVLGAEASKQIAKPFEIATLPTALDWCEAAARHEKYALGDKLGDPPFRRGLLAGVSADMRRDTLTRSEVMAIVANTRFPTIRVLETTDFHGAIQPRARRQGRALGGSAVLAAHVERLRAENPEGTVLLDGGDCFQGTMISNLAFGRPVVEQMNHLRYAAAAIGNHEFDWSADTLVRRVHEMKFAALGANMTEKKGGKRPVWARADTSVVRRGVRIGVLGLAYPFTPSVTLPAYVAHLSFADDSTTAARLAPKLRKAGAELVLGVGHIPASRDSGGAVRGDLARLTRGVPAVDAWFGGHSHNEILGTIDGRTLLIAGSRGEAVGVCDIVVDPVRNRVVEQSARIVNTWADEVTPDSAFAAMVARWDAGVSVLAAEEVGRNARRLTRGRSVESTVGNFVADAIREAAKADMALQNSGGLRADLPEGAVTKGTIYEVMPFDNTIVTVELTGAEVKKLLEEALGGGRTLQVSGMRYRFDADRPRGQRLLEVRDAQGQPLEDGRRYTVAVNNFMATGGDDLSVLGAAANKVETNLLVRDAMETFVRARTARGQSLDYKVEGRIERAGTAASDD